MRSNFFYVGVVVVFAVVVIIYGATNSKLSDEIASISAENVEVINPELTVSFPVTMTFKRPAPLNKTRFTPVQFSHFDHQDVNCVTCHHTWDGKSQVQSCASVGCHDELKAKAEPRSYFKAFHTLKSERSCRGCHVKLNNAGEADLRVAPCANNDCHPKPKYPVR